MKASELIKFLQFYIDNMGDNEVRTNSIFANHLVSVDMKEDAITLTFKDMKGQLV